MLRIQNISISYGEQEVIHDLTLNILAGEFIALLGPNGAGKSTLLHAISGQMKPDFGTIEFSGQDIYQHNLAYKKQIGFVHEVPFFYANLTTDEFLQFVGKIKSEPLSLERTSELLEKVNLVDEQHKLASELSMGMRKKLAIAAALIGQPKIVFLDVVLFMSDGFPEMFNKKNEELGDERAKNLFEEAAEKPPKQIISHLVEAGKKWSNGEDQKDDVTFMIIKLNLGNLRISCNSSNLN